MSTDKKNNILEYTDEASGKTIRIYEALDKPGCTTMEFDGRSVTSRINIDKALAEMQSLDTLKGKWYCELFDLYVATGSPLFRAGFMVAVIQDKELVKGILMWLALQNNSSNFNPYRGGKHSKISDEQIIEILKHRGNVSNFCKKNNINRETYYKVKNVQFKNDYDNNRVKKLKESLGL